MSWLLFAIAARFLWAIVNLGDKFVITHRFKNPYVYMSMMLCIGAVFSMLMIPFVDFEVPNLQNLFWLLMVAMTTLLASYIYVKAMKMEDPTRINIWWGFMPIFALILSWIFIDEELTGLQLVAFILLVMGTFVAGWHFKKRTIKFSKAVYLMIIACFFLAITAVLVRFISKDVSAINIFLWQYIFMALLSVLLLMVPRFFRAFKTEIRDLKMSSWGIVTALSIIDLWAILFNATALTLASAALVSSIESLQVIFVFIMVFVLEKFAKIDLKEELDKKNTVLKVVAIILASTGLFLLYLN